MPLHFRVTIGGFLPNSRLSYYMLHCRRSIQTNFSTTTTVPETVKRVKIHNLEHGIRHVQLCRPEKLNALDLQMFKQIANAAKQIRADTSARSVIISGEGKSFCTGIDIRSILKPSKEDGILPTQKIRELLQSPSGYERQQHSDEVFEDSDDISRHSSTSISNSETTTGIVDDLYQNSEAVGNLAQDVVYLWRNLPIPVICVIKGMCFGGGLQLALGADLRYATKDCKISVMEAKWGLIPDMCATITLRELVRIDVAKELTFTGKIIDGQEAEKLGLVTRCCSDPMEEAMNVAKVISKRSPDCSAAAKILYQKSWFASEKNCVELESDIQKRILLSWNQIAASARNFGINIPYKERQSFDN